MVALGKAAELALKVFQDSELAAAATRLRDGVDAAIQAHGVWEGNISVPRMYAFEVDGFGNQARPPRVRNTKGYPSTCLAMGFANVRVGTQNWRGVFVYPPEH